MCQTVRCSFYSNTPDHVGERERLTSLPLALPLKLSWYGDLCLAFVLKVPRWTGISIMPLLGSNEILMRGSSTEDVKDRWDTIRLKAHWQSRIAQLHCPYCNLMSPVPLPSLWQVVKALLIEGCCPPRQMVISGFICIDCARQPYWALVIALSVS